MDNIRQKLSLTEHLSIAVRMLLFTVRQFPLLIILIFILNTAIALIPAASIWVGKLIIDTIVDLVSQKPQATLHYLFTLVAIEFAILLTQGILNKVVSFFNSKYASLFEMIMSQKILEKCEKIPYYHFENPDFYNRFELIKNQVASGSSSYLTQQLNLFQATIKLISISYILIRIDFLFLLAAVFLNILNFIIGIKLSNRNFDVEYDLSKPNRLNEYFFKLLTDIASLKDIKLFNLGSHFRKQHLKRSKYIIDKRLVFFRKELILYTAFEFISTLTFYAFYVYIIWGVIKRRLTVGDITLYQRSYSTLDGALSGFISNFSSIYTQNLYMKLYLNFMAYDEELSLSQTPLTKIENISFHNVSFAYPGDPDRCVLNQVNFDLRKGEALVVTGENGSGKTTLLKLLTLLFEPTAGEVRINNIKGLDVSKEEFRQRLGVMFQDYNRYELSCHENIILGNVKNKGDEQALDRAISQTELMTFINKLPQGSATHLTRIFEAGISPSSGQWQKVALARVLFRDPDLIILDEPTANLDYYYSRHVFNLLQDLVEKQNKMLIVVSHNKEFLQLSDNILFIDAYGKATQGSHQALSASNKSYSHLWISE